MSAQDFSNLKPVILAAIRQGRRPAAQSGIFQPLEEVTLVECQKLVIDYLQRRTSEILRLVPPRYPKPHQSLIDLGFDSLMAMELRYQFETELEVCISPKEFIGI